LPGRHLLVLQYSGDLALKIKKQAAELKRV
jgi:hypothetical protein